MIKKFIATVLMLLSFSAFAQASKTEVFFGDDTWVNVPLQFPFPFYGKIFTNSFMFSNGVVGFFGVDTQPQTSFCCSGVQVNNQLWSGFNYTIMPMQTDLYPVEQSRFYTQGNSNYQKYWWENIAEISNFNNLNTFSVEIKPSGYIGIKYDLINIQNQQVTSAIIGDASKGEYTLHYHGLGMNASSVANLIEYQSTGNACVANPLSDPSCPGYAQAYHDQQCSVNPLYAVTCPGYQQAYFNQQCTANPLYNSACPGYAEAYKSQQCTLNPLFATDCPGYQQAYFNQQCELDGLYSQSCPNYAIAYARRSLFEQQGIASSVDIAGTTAKNDPKNTTTNSNTVTQIESQPETTSVTSSTSVSPAAVTSVVRPPAPPMASPQQVVQVGPVGPGPQAQNQQQQRQEQTKSEEKVANSIERKMDSKSDSKSNSPQDRQKVKDAVAKVQKEIAKETQEAKTIEAQVANQGLVVGSMNFVPGFDAYRNAIIPDINGLIVARQYGKPVVDNQRAQRRLSGANETKWQDMVDSQYKLGR